MDSKTEALLIGGVAAVIVVVIASLKGGSQSTSAGVAFSAPDPSSVASVTNAGIAALTSQNALTADRINTAAGAAVALAQTNAQLQLGTITANDNMTTANYGAATAAQVANFNTATSGAVSVSNTAAALAAATQDLGIQSATSVQNNLITSGAQTTQAQLQTAAAEYGANVSAQSNATLAQIAANLNLALGTVQSNNALTATQAQLGVAKDISNNQVTAARIGKAGPSFGSILGGVLSGAANAFTTVGTGGTSQLGSLLGLGSIGSSGGGIAGGYSAPDMANSSFGSYA